MNSHTSHNQAQRVVQVLAGLRLKALKTLHFCGFVMGYVTAISAISIGSFALAADNLPRFDDNSVLAGEGHYMILSAFIIVLLLFACITAILRMKQNSLKMTKKALTDQVDALTTSLLGAQNTNTALLNEIDHRLKNNLQTIISLTNFEIRRVDRREQDASRALKDLMGRLEAIAIIQKCLSYRPETKAISAQNLLDNILSFTAQRCTSIKSTETEANELLINPVVATPLGLAFHEICSFAAESCAKRQDCKIQVKFFKENDKQVLEVRAMGLGPEAGKIDFSSELGAEIIDMLASQVDADLDVHADENESYWQFSYLYDESKYTQSDQNTHQPPPLSGTFAT